MREFLAVVNGSRFSMMTLRTFLSSPEFSIDTLGERPSVPMQVVNLLPEEKEMTHRRGGSCSGKSLCCPSGVWELTVSAGREEQPWELRAALTCFMER